MAFPRSSSRLTVQSRIPHFRVTLRRALRIPVHPQGFSKPPHPRVITAQSVRHPAASRSLRPGGLPRGDTIIDVEESVLDEPVLTARGAGPAAAPRPRGATHDTPAAVDGFPASRALPAARPAQSAQPAPVAQPAPAAQLAPAPQPAPAVQAGPPAPAPAAAKICIAGELPPPAPGQAVKPWLAQFCYTVAIVAALAALVGLWLMHR